MKLPNVILILLVVSLVFNCKSLQWIPIENTNQYQLEKGKNQMVKMDAEKVTGTMQWNKQDEACSANYSSQGKSYCLKYLGRPDYLVEITEDENSIGNIKGIKKHVSILEWDGEEYTLRPIKGKIVALYQDEAIARIYNSKRDWFLEITPEHEDNQLLIASLIYKDWEWQKSNNYAEDWWIWIALLPALM